MRKDETPSEVKRRSLYTYWHELPFYKNVDSVVYNKLVGSEVRNFIIKYIRDGIEDEFGKANGLKRRHAFTAKELQEAFEEKTKNKDYSPSNFHFHINALIGEGFIIEIAKILEGRHYRTYFGRTAISISPTLDVALSRDMEQDIFNPMKKMAKEFQPDLDDAYVNQLFEENMKLFSNYYFRINRWLKEKYPQIYASQLDMLAFLNFAGHFSVIDPSLSENLKHIARLIKFDDILEYQNTPFKEEL